MWQEYASFLHCVNIRQNVSQNRHFNNVKNVFCIFTSQSLFLHEWQSYKNSIRIISFSFRLCLWIWNHDLLTYFSVTDYIFIDYYWTSFVWLYSMVLWQENVDAIRYKKVKMYIFHISNYLNNKSNLQTKSIIIL